MAYDELEGKELEENEMYEDEALYEPADTFGEQIGETGAEESAYDSEERDTSTPSSGTSRVEDAFGETLSNEKNPHLADQMDDSKLNEEAQSDYKDADMEELEE